MMDVPTLIRELNALSPDDRRRVWEAVRPEVPVPFEEVLSEADVREVNRLLDLADAGQLSGDPLDVVKARWRAQK
jgi:hypothetical protein